VSATIIKINKTRCLKIKLEKDSHMSKKQKFV